MAILTICKETALPGVLQANAMYLIAPPSKPDYVEIYITDKNGTVAKRIPTTDDIQSLINAATGAIDPGSKLEIVANITARDLLAPTGNITVVVLDATDDPNVATGAATYVYELSTTTWHKISEAESMDLVLDWVNVTNKPNSSVADIDDAVSKRHSHSNLTQLNKIDQDAEGNFTYGGVAPKAALETNNW